MHQEIGGVGIQSIEYLGTQLSGGTNKLIITLTNGTSYTFNIYNGKDGQGGTPTPTPQEVLREEVLTLYRGPLSQAQQIANTDPTTMFQYILDGEINGETFTKIIWHIGNGQFIDALGAIIQ